MERQLDLDFNPMPGVIRFPNTRARLRRARSVSRGKLVVFPPAKRADLVREVAAELDARNSASAETYWEEVVDVLEGQMQGQPAEAVLRLLQDFRSAVQRELDGLGAGPLSGRHSPGGGVA